MHVLRAVCILWLLCGLIGATTADRASAAPAFDDGTTYVVRPGDTLSQIALAHGVSPEALAQANGLRNADFIWAGQRLTIPAASSYVGPVQNTGREYTVRPGDTLASIAYEHGISLTALIAANALRDPDRVYVGQKLRIPGAPDGASLPATSLGQVRYTVRAGDTLSAVAARYDTSVASIVRANGLTNADAIREGMALIIPSPRGVSANFTGQVSRFVVSITQQRCWLYAGQNVIADWPCSTGQRGAGTNPGTYAVQSKLERAYGSTWDIWMPYWLGIYWAGGSENGIHGIPYSASSGWRLWERYVGTPVTYGCVLLDDVNARILYDLAYIGMPVIILP